MNLEVVEEEIAVPGFRFGGVACGVKRSGAPDCAVLVADRPAVAAGVFTTNLFAAAPVGLARERLRLGMLQAVVVNSGNANACTGKQGVADAGRSCAIAAARLGVSPALVAPASTGIIGVELPMAKLGSGIEAAVDDATEGGAWRFARAIMTTDAFPKVAYETVTIGRRRVTVAGIAKGAGMIAPDMATLLVFLVTDAAIDRTTARRLAREAGAPAFNELSVDGDTSTNDSLFLLASGAAGNAPADGRGKGGAALGRAVAAVADELARLVARDGEGATKVVVLDVRGAPTTRDAALVARAVGRSQLVKTAFFGADPNWGRIACAVGYSGARIAPEGVRIRIGEVEVFRAGRGIAAATEAARAVMRRPEFVVTIVLGGGPGRARMRTTDLSQDYVHLNSAYST